MLCLINILTKHWSVYCLPACCNHCVKHTPNAFLQRKKNQSHYKTVCQLLLCDNYRLIRHFAERCVKAEYTISQKALLRTPMAGGGGAQLYKRRFRVLCGLVDKQHSLDWNLFLCLPASQPPPTTETPKSPSHTQTGRGEEHDRD